MKILIKSKKESILSNYKKLLKQQRKIEKSISNEQREYDYKAKKLENKHNEIIDSLIIDQKQVRKELSDVREFVDKIRNSESPNFFEEA